MATNLGCFNLCDDIPLQAATENGIHYINIRWLNNEVNYSSFYAISDAITFVPSSNPIFNEHTVYYVTVRNPSSGPLGSGQEYSFRVNNAINL